MGHGGAGIFNMFKTSLLGTAAAVCFVTAGPTAALAQTPGASAQTEDTVSEIVVTGYARSLQRATTLKREADHSLDAVTAEDIGKFPSLNAAEALQTVPGVTLDRQRGQGLFISVRGLGPQFQNVELNGRSVAINELIENGGAQGRNFRFEVLPSELVSSIEVVKAPTADMNDGALGGNIDVHTFRPLDLGSRAAVSVRASYNDLAEKTDPSVSGLYSWNNADRTLGVLVSGLYDERTVRNDRFFNFGWVLDRFTPAANGGLPAGLYAPTRTRPTIELEDRERASGSIALQWRPNDDFQTDFDFLITRLDVDFDEFGLDIYPDDRTFRQPVFRAGTRRVVGDTIVAGTIDNVRWMASRETSLNRHDLQVWGLKQTWTPGEWTVTGDLTYSYARSYHPDGLATTRNRISYFAPLTFDFSRGYQKVGILTGPVDYNDPANYLGDAFDYTRKDSRDTDQAAKLDAYRTFDGVLTRIAFGAQYREREREYIRRDIVLNTLLGVPVSTLGSNFVTTLPFTNFLSDFGGDSPRSWVAPSRTAFYDRLYTDAVRNQAPSAADLRSSFEVEETVSAAYVRGDFGFDVGTIPVTGNLGLRYTQTEQEARGTLVIGTTPTPAAFPKTYDDWLPSLNLRAELTDTLVARAAASRVLTRPNLVDIAPRITVSRDSPTASGGNPDLEPFLATQADASLEWYFAPTGSLTGAVFYKKLDDYITAANTTIQVPGRGDILLSSLANGGEAKLTGFEAAYNQVFDFLPAPFDGLGLQASFTLVDVESEFTSGARTITDELIGLSKTSYNLVAFYERDRVQARIGYFWREKFLSGAGSTTQAQTFVDDFGSLDGSISFDVTDIYAVTLEATNLTNAYKFTYAGTTDRPSEINDYGRTLTLSLRARF